MPHLQEALARLNEDSQSNTAKGKKFERFMQVALEKHPEYGEQRFKQILTWQEWRDLSKAKGELDPGIDIGIDLVGIQQESFGGGLCAIQCKNYANNKVATTDVNKFLAASSNPKWTHRILIAPFGLDRVAQKKLDDSTNATVINAAEIDNWPIGDLRELLEQPESLIFDVEKYAPRDYQEEALKAIKEGLFDPPAGGEGAGREGAARGRVILPCGTGKSVVALWAAERYVGVGKRVLYLVPSIALLGQTMREWAMQRNPNLPHRYLSVCSDSRSAREAEDTNLSDLAIPPTTDAGKIASELKREEPDHLTCVFSTYQSLPKIIEAQNQGAPEFDLVICDEAHRTAAVSSTTSNQHSNQPTKPATRAQEEISFFTAVHSDDNIATARRLYMTATPRLYSDTTASKAADYSMDVYSMDDPKIYGPMLYEKSFGEAIEEGLLADYHVVVVAVDEEGSARFANSQVADLDMKTSQQLLGFWDALSDPHTEGISKDRPAGVVNPSATPPPVRRAIAFTNTIAESRKVEQYWQKHLGEVREFSAATYTKWEKTQSEQKKLGHALDLDVQHIDGKMNAYDRAKHINWLRDTDQQEGNRQDQAGDTTKILTNARCLTEGVDIPALDAVLFLSPRKSEIEIVQAVGRVMRRTPGKDKEEDKGYVILPVIVPQGKKATAEEVLSSSAWNSVWQVVRALRAHDNRMTGYLSSPRMARKAPITIIDNTEVAKTERDDGISPPVQPAMFESLPLTVASMLVNKVGDRKLWPRWGQEVEKIVARIRERIEAAVTDPSSGAEVAEIISEYSAAMRAALNSKNVGDEDLLDLLAQHIVTAPVLDALFAEQKFAKTNPMSRALGAVYDALLGDMESQTAASQTTTRQTTTPKTSANDTTSDDILGLRRELESLQRFHSRMKLQLSEIKDSDARLDTLLNLYESFFQKAMPAETKRLGIAYTPVELVDFTLRSVDAVCRHNLGLEDGVGAENVHVLDPFTGTGTFINRLITIGREPAKNPTAEDLEATSEANPGEYLISGENLDRKYFGAGTDKPQELHATELMLLAYYIAALKIEEGYRQRSRLSSHKPAEFKGLLLADTFMESVAHTRTRLPGMDENEERLRQRENIAVRAIVTNPPWSSGQDSAGHDNQNKDYPELSNRVKDTYVKRHKEITGRAPGGNAAGNLYILSFRWATDRLSQEHGGVLAFIHPNSLADGTSLAGMRAFMQEDFTDIYVVNLRGNAYKQGEERKKEGDNVFEGASKNGVQITVAVRNPAADQTKPATVRYAQVPDYLTREEKFKWLSDLGNVLSGELKEVPFNEEHDWVDVSDGSYKNLIPLCVTTTQKGDLPPMVAKHARGVGTSCDTYVYSFNRQKLLQKIDKLTEAFNEQLNLAWKHLQENPNLTTRELTNMYTKNDRLSDIKWTDTLKDTLRKKLNQAKKDNRAPTEMQVDPSKCRHVLYRPFTKLWLYEDAEILSSVKTVAAMFPRNTEKTDGGGYGEPSYHAYESLQHGVTNGPGDDNIAGSAHIGTESSNTSGTAVTDGGGVSAILVTSPSNKTQFTVLASRTISDLCAAGSTQPSRTIPRQYS